MADELAGKATKVGDLKMEKTYTVNGKELTRTAAVEEVALAAHEQAAAMTQSKEAERRWRQAEVQYQTASNQLDMFMEQVCKESSK